MRPTTKPFLIPFPLSHLSHLRTFSPSRLRTFTLFLILFLTFSFLLLPCSFAQYADGDGSPEFPFQIAEPNQLIYMSQHPEDWDKCFILTADLNMNLYDSPR